MKKLTSYSTVSNKGFLLDTHVFIWWMEKNKRLPKSVYKILENPQNSIFLSVATLWEIILKKGKGKLKASVDAETLQKSGFITLPIQAAHVLNVEHLPNYHKDPFDRLLIAQSRVENLNLICSDPKIWKYDIDVLKC